MEFYYLDQIPLTPNGLTGIPPLGLHHVQIHNHQQKQKQQQHQQLKKKNKESLKYLLGSSSSHSTY